MVRTLTLGTCVIAGLAATALLDGESGVPIWRALRQDLAVASGRVASLASQNAAMREEIAAFEAEPAALDRAIREELDLALPGEIVVRFDSDRDAGPGADDLAERRRPGFSHRLSATDSTWVEGAIPGGDSAGRRTW